MGLLIKHKCIPCHKVLHYWATSSFVKGLSIDQCNLHALMSQELLYNLEYFFLALIKVALLCWNTNVYPCHRVLHCWAASSFVKELRDPHCRCNLRAIVSQELLFNLEPFKKVGRRHTQMYASKGIVCLLNTRVSKAAAAFFSPRSRLLLGKAISKSNLWRLRIASVAKTSAQI